MIYLVYINDDACSLTLILNGCTRGIISVKFLLIIYIHFHGIDL